MPPNGVQKLISQNQEVKINATGPWPLDDLHLQYLNITFFIIFIWSGGSIYALAKISELIQSIVWLPHAGHISVFSFFFLEIKAAKLLMTFAVGKLEADTLMR